MSTLKEIRFSISEPIRLLVDFDTPFEQQVSSAGFDWVDETIDPLQYQTPRNGRCGITARLLSFPKMERVGIDLVLAKIRELGSKTADPRIMVQLSVNHPNIETHSQIVATEPEVRGRCGNRLLLSFWLGNRKRHLGYGRWGNASWLGSTTFLLEETALNLNP